MPPANPSNVTWLYRPFSTARLTPRREFLATGAALLAAAYAAAPAAPDRAPMREDEAQQVWLEFRKIPDLATY